MKSVEEKTDLVLNILALIAAIVVAVALAGWLLPFALDNF